MCIYYNIKTPVFYIKIDVFVYLTKEPGIMKMMNITQNI